MDKVYEIKYSTHQSRKFGWEDYDQIFVATDKEDAKRQFEKECEEKTYTRCGFNDVWREGVKITSIKLYGIQLPKGV